jgi:hypothetical protein
LRKWRVKRREILVDGFGTYLCPHCSNVVLKSKIEEPLFYDDNMNYILDRCDIGKTNTTGLLHATKPKDNMTLCTTCKNPAFSYGHELGNKKTVKNPYTLKDELFEI